LASVLNCIFVDTGFTTFPSTIVVSYLYKEATVQLVKLRHDNLLIVAKRAMLEESRKNK
jgi:hypothetical protein